MGVDIYGVDPIMRSMGPEEIDWTTATDEQIDQYYEDLGQHRDLNPGVYFRASWWGWRPIIGIVNLLAPEIDTTSWHYNDGTGLTDPEECKALAEVIDNWLSDNTLYTDNNDSIYVNFGSWRTADDKMLDPDKADFLNVLYPIGTVVPGMIATSEGELVQTSHVTDVSHLKEFSNFLKECNGFKIY